MVRSILLGLLATGIIPITLINATATAVSQKQINFPQQSTDNLNLATPCTFKQRSLCPTETSDNKPKIDSELWLKDLGNILLSGSMFKGCRTEPKKQYYSEPQVQSSLSKIVPPECIFLRQQPSEINPETNNSPALLSTKLESYPRPQNSIQPNILPASPTTTPKFPKLSRSSLIVSFPSADSSFVPSNTKLVNPAPETKRIASPFGWRRRPYSDRLQFHQGIDYGAPLGSPVVSVGNGIVTKVVSGCYDFGNLFCGGQLGNWIEIDHGNGAIAIYGHLKNNSIAVKEGMKVWKNQEIAQVGSSGWSTGAHLDFRFKVNGEYEDPAKHLTPPNFSKF